MRVALINYGMGNLGSVRRALEDLGAEVLVAEHPAKLLDAHRVVLPGVGAFGEAMERLRAGGWVDALQRQVGEEEKPLLGICLGMQMLSNGSEEGEPTAGLGFIPGRVRLLKSLGCSLRIPHVGWNDVKHREGCPLFDEIPQGMDFYFVHSYAFEAEDPRFVAATTSYGVDLAAAVWRRHVLGTQFHPEKSSRAGRRLLKNFLDFVPC